MTEWGDNRETRKTVRSERNGSADALTKDGVREAEAAGAGLCDGLAEGEHAVARHLSRPTAKSAVGGVGRNAPKPLYLGHRERLRERFLTSPDALPDYELLEMLLFSAKTRVDTKPLAKLLISHLGSFGGVLNADPARIREIKGCNSDAVVAALKVVREAAVRLARAEILQRPVIGSWQSLLDYCQIAMAQSLTEQFRILFLDRRHALIADELQQEGTIDHTPVYPREVVKRALEIGASALIMIHNHPSGDPTPSRADIEMTRQVRDAAKGVGITLHDHLVIGHGRHASFKSLGLL